MLCGAKMRAQLSPSRLSPPPVLPVLPADRRLLPPTNLPHLLGLDDHLPLDRPFVYQSSINSRSPSDAECLLPLPVRTIKPIDMASMDAVSTACLTNAGSCSRCRSTIYSIL